MELNNDFEVSAPIDKAWAILTDVERIAPCLPGAQLQEVEGDEYRGIVKVKVGPITAQYKGAATFVERDDANHRAVLKADGRDTRGAGNASAMITAHAEPVGDRTKVTVSTDLTVTGKVAQFGRGVMADVSAKLMGQFADNLGALLESGAGDGASGAAAAAAPEPPTAAADAAPADPAPEVSAPAAEPAALNGASSAPSAGVRRIDSPEPEAVDLLDTAGAPVLKRLLPVVGVVLAFFLLRHKLRSRRRK
ncbi:MAG TPA: SRPBCC family protein [Acidimicrobiales bacterium]|nr:SRPBCC family protein [Acidimicrobiales bacterium]